MARDLLVVWQGRGGRAAHTVPRTVGTIYLPSLHIREQVGTDGHGGRGFSCFGSLESAYTEPIDLGIIELLLLTVVGNCVLI